MAKQVSHTHGPWQWDGKFTVTIPHHDGETSFRTNREDARLIAAAPDLLSALEFALSEGSGFACPETTEARMREAVAKAAGAR